ncbi:serine hydrolase [Bordetella sp. N]|nr:serine hydrolase [Bordetella sp. N]
MPNEIPGVAIPPGQIAAAVGRLDELARALRKRTRIPGIAVAVVLEGQKIFAQGYGLRNNKEGGDVDADTVFQLASVSKSIGATVIAREVGEKRVAWNDRITQYLPWFKLSDSWVSTQLTLADLYAHRSGLPDHGGDDLEELGYDRTQILERLRYLPLHPFRSTYEYTNFGVTAAAEAVATAAGVDWATLSEHELYRPLRMDRSSSRYADFARRDNRAHGHIKQDGEYVPRYQREPDAQSPAGGVSSSVNDMAKWLAMLIENGNVQGRPFIPAAALLPAITPQIVSRAATSPNARADTYGYGFNVNVQASGRTDFNHSGAFGLGAGTAFAVIPSARVGIVVLTNAAPIGAAEALIAEFMELVQFGSISRDWFAAYQPLFAPYAERAGSLVDKHPPENAAPPRAPAAYLGVYGNPYFGDAHVVEGRAGLELVLGPKAMRFAMRHWDGDRYTIAMHGENYEEGSVSAVDFKFGDSDTAAAVSVELLETNRLGTFARR